jgi:single heme cytochrome PccH
MQMKLVAAAIGILVSLPTVAQDVTYRGQIAGLMKKNCVQCHGPDSPSLAEFKLAEGKFTKEKKGPSMNSYAELIQFVGWPDTGALMRRLDDGANTADRKPGNMYKQLGETDAERAENLKIFKAWVGNDAWNLNRFQARGTVPAVTKDQLDKLKIKY